MAAEVYGTSEGLTVLIVERHACGGQAETSSRIENALRLSRRDSGDDLTGRGFKQATRFGAEIALTRCVEKLIPLEKGFRFELDGGQTVPFSRQFPAIAFGSFCPLLRRGQHVMNAP
jgi:thioredoxin reductase (NADPH)